MTYSTLISADRLRALIEQRACHVVDCRFDLADTTRGEAAFAQGRIPGACYAHLDRDLSGPIVARGGRHPLPDVNRLCGWLGRQGIGRATQVVAYDDSGGTMAVRLWWLLRWLGHERAALLDGGWQHWLTAGLPVERERATRPNPTAFTGDPDARRLVSTSQLHDQVTSGCDTWLIMDARTRDRFRGDAEPIDPVAGHIPGAVNLPLQMNLTANGSFLPAEALRGIYVDRICDRDPRDVVAMCGSGVTACHNLLAMEIAGLAGGRLYVGSWSEWIRDPVRPVATGD